MDNITQQVKAVMEEFIPKAKIKSGDILVVGCSTSEVVGSKIGTNSSPETAKVLFEALYDCAKSNGIYLAIQCCEHLNRALIVERDTAEKFCYEIVSVRPVPKAGGSFATAVYDSMRDPVAVEEVKATLGMDIGLTMIGMHMKNVAVPIRLYNDHIYNAIVIAAYSRPKLIGGVRAVYK